MWDFIRKLTKEAVECEHFYTRFDEEWKSGENVIGQKGVS